MFGGVMVRTSDLQSAGREFRLPAMHCRVTTLGKLFAHMCFCHQFVTGVKTGKVLWKIIEEM